MKRREFISGAAATGLGLAATAGAGSAQAQSYADLATLSVKDLNYRNFSSLGPSRNVGVMGYNFGLVFQNGLGAMASGNNVQVSSAYQLAGMTVDLMQAIAAKAQADLIAQLAAAGRPILTTEQMHATQAFQALKSSAIPFRKQPAADARRVVIAPPTGQGLYLTAVDSPLTDKSPFDQASVKALHMIGMELDAVILIPTLVIDVASLSRSGNSIYSGGASVGIEPGLFMVELFSGLNVYHARNKIAGDGGRGALQKRVRLGQAGQLVEASSYSNRDEVAWWNSRVNSGMATPGEIGPTFAYAHNTYKYVVEPTLFQMRALAAASALNRASVQAVSQFKRS
ncbi:MAG TPA: hypothetical protein PLF78_03610 [Caulobacter sp.]|nr:hypothetical protein [Caulobacter sp.]